MPAYHQNAFGALESTDSDDDDASLANTVATQVAALTYQSQLTQSTAATTTQRQEMQLAQLAATQEAQHATLHQIIKGLNAVAFNVSNATDKDFPLQLWDRLTPHVTATLNMLRPSRKDPSMSAYEAIYGPYDWNWYPLAPPGCKAVIYEAPETRGSWASHGTDAWYLGPSLDHYRCNHYFVPDMRAYRISGSAELFPQHCQVPFLMWNENLQEVLGELRTSLQELPPEQRTKIVSVIKNKLDLRAPTQYTRTLTDANHQWLLPRSDIQLNPYIPTQDKQRVPIPQPPTSPLDPCTTHTPQHVQRVSDAPPIMQAPNSTQKRTLRRTPRTHMRRTRRNIPGRVPPITPTATRELATVPSDPMPPRRSPRLTAAPPRQTATQSRLP